MNIFLSMVVALAGILLVVRADDMTRYWLERNFPDTSLAAPQVSRYTAVSRVIGLGFIVTGIGFGCWFVLR